MRFNSEANSANCEQHLLCANCPQMESKSKLLYYSCECEDTQQYFHYNCLKSWIKRFVKSCWDKCGRHFVSKKWFSKVRKRKENAISIVSIIAFIVLLLLYITIIGVALLNTANVQIESVIRHTLISLSVLFAVLIIYGLVCVWKMKFNGLLNYFLCATHLDSVNVCD